MQQAARRQFLNDYGKIRQAEGRGSDDAAYYLALPYRDLTGKNSAQWEIRAKSYDYLAHKVLPTIESKLKRPLDVLDLGAGNGWLSYRLALRQHHPVALDIFGDSSDGLGSARHYPLKFPLIEADFDHLPFPSLGFDLAIYNSSIHYSADYVRTLTEARRVLRPGGTIIIMDSPVYRRREDGLRMVSERHENFARQYGFRSDALPSIEFFDEAMLEEIARGLHLEWRVHRPWYGWQWHLRPLKAAVLRRRPPSRFWILEGRFGEQ